MILQRNLVLTEHHDRFISHEKLRVHFLQARVRTTSCPQQVISIPFHPSTSSPSSLHGSKNNRLSLQNHHSKTHLPKCYYLKTTIGPPVLRLSPSHPRHSKLPRHTGWIALPSAPPPPQFSRKRRQPPDSRQQAKLRCGADDFEFDFSIPLSDRHSHLVQEEGGGWSKSRTGAPADSRR